LRRPWRDAGSDLAGSKGRLSHRHGINRRGDGEPGRLLGFCFAMRLRLGRCPQPRSVCLRSKSGVPSGTQKMIGMGFQGRCPWLMSLVPPGRFWGPIRVNAVLPLPWPRRPPLHAGSCTQPSRQRADDGLWAEVVE
jgi:hypothetical protein